MTYQIIEKCLVVHNNHFDLIMAAVNRARELSIFLKKPTKITHKKHTIISLIEISKGNNFNHDFDELNMQAKHFGRQIRRYGAVVFIKHRKKLLMIK